VTVAQFVATGFLTISSVAFLAQAAFLVALFIQRRTNGPPRRGLIRTVACRVFAAGLYVGLGISAFLLSTEVELVTSFIVYSSTQCLWAVNSAADRRLGRQPALDTTRDTEPSTPLSDGNRG
jgi:hypothetical protein